MPRVSGRFDCLSPHEVLTLLKQARAYSLRDWCMMLVAYRHGLRSSEICALSLADVDLHASVIRCARLKDSLPTVQPLERHPGQPLLDEIKALKQWLKSRPRDGSEALFTSQKGGRMDRSTYFRAFQKHAGTAGLEARKCHPHVMKHSIASHLVDRNVGLAFVQQRLGHRSIGSTMKYVHLRPGRADELAQNALMALY